MMHEGMRATKAAIEYVRGLLIAALNEEQKAVVLVQWVHDQMRASMTSAGGARYIPLLSPGVEMAVYVWHILWLVGQSSYIDDLGRVTVTAQTWQITFEKDASEEAVEEACGAVLRALQALATPEVLNA